MNVSTAGTSALLRNSDVSSGIQAVINRSPDAQMARITRAEWAHFQSTYRPFENEMLQKAMQTDFSQEGDKAGVDAASLVSAASGMAERNMRRSGVSMSAEEQAAFDRRKALATTKSVASAENVTRRSLSESRLDMLAGMVGIGRGVSATARSGLQSAADIAAQRSQFNMQQRTNARNTNLSTAASAAMLMIAFA